jgi:DNA-binding response OmpR family regulator
LAYLIRTRLNVLTYGQLIKHIWRKDEQGTRHSLIMHLSQLRRKIEKDPKNPRYIQTRWGVGYIYSPD